MVLLRSEHHFNKVHNTITKKACKEAPRRRGDTSSQESPGVSQESYWYLARITKTCDILYNMWLKEYKKGFDQDGARPKDQQRVQK